MNITDITDITKQIRAFADQLEEQNKPDATPFQLPPPPPGMSWHRTDGWKTEDLPPGTRPHVLGEEDYPEDSELRADGWRSCIRQKYGSTDEDFHRRTTRPLEFEHEGKSWTYHRPGDPMPCDGEVFVDCLCDNEGEITGTRAKVWAWKGNIIGWRYAEPLTREVALGPEDVPPMTLLRGGGEVGSKGWCLITSCSEVGIRIWRQSEASGREITWQRLRESESQINRPCHRDADGNPTKWEPCHKTIPQNG